MSEELNIEAFTKNFKLLVQTRNHLRFETKYFFKQGGSLKHFDAILYQNEELLAVFEFKHFVDFKLVNNLNQYKIDISYKYLVISNGKVHNIYNLYSGKTEKCESEKELLDLLIEKPSKEQIDFRRNEIAKIIENTVDNFLGSFVLKNHSLLVNRSKLIKHFLFDNLLPNIGYNEDGQFYHFIADVRDLNSFENNFFKLLIQPVESGETIYRYSTIETLFSTLNNKSVRLNGIPGMNDISEVGYVEHYLDESFIPFQNAYDLDQINRRFILCCSSLADDLMQWRLYGDDCKGACFVFDVSAFNNISGIQVRKINYGIEKSGENYHPELDLIKKIIENIKIQLGEAFQFRTFSIWKHFFKSYEYSPEKEVRLLIIVSPAEIIKGITYQNKNNSISITKSWCLTNSHKIANPFITVTLEDLKPILNLKEVILGTKCPEVETNQFQFIQLAAERNLSIKIKKSKITNYR